jgi:L-asparaginase II
MTVMPMTAATHRVPAAQPPVLVEVTRGEMVESRHAGSIAVLDARGKTVLACGDVAQAIYPRSAIKPIQALPLIEAGAAERYKLGDAEIALACASHGGEPRHVATVLSWLGRIGCTVDDLECGGHPPSNEAAAEALYRGNGVVTALHNNCSGKHTGFLSLAKHNDWPTRGYIKEEHPVQQAVLKTLAELSGADLARGARGIDGCGIPVVGLPLQSLALAMARFADPSGLPAERQAAIKRIRTAMTKEPFMVAGTGRFCTRAMSQLGEAAIVKTGAEGVFMAALPTLGFGVCLKMADGAARSAQVALAAVMDRLGLAGAKELVETPLKNVAGRAVGVVRPAADLPF